MHLTNEVQASVSGRARVFLARGLPIILNLRDELFSPRTREPFGLPDKSFTVRDHDSGGILPPWRGNVLYKDY